MSGPYQESSLKTSGPEPGHFDYTILAPLFCESNFHFFGHHLNECQMISTATFISPLSLEAIYQLLQGSAIQKLVAAAPL